MNMLAQRIVPISPLKARRKRNVRQSLIGASAAIRPETGHIGEILVRMGCLLEEDVNKILVEQQSSGKRFGRAAIDLRLVRPDDICAAMGVQHGYLREIKSPVSIPRDLVLVRRRLSPAAEQFRKITTHLLTSSDADLLNCFSLISAAPHRGSAYVEANLATAFAQLGKKTLVIDADLKGQRLAPFFGLQQDFGLSDVLTGRAPLRTAIVESVVKNLSLLPAGYAPHNAQELLGSAEFVETLEQAEKDYDIVMVMTAPFGAAADGQFAWAATKAAFVSAQRDVTRSADLKQLSAVLQKLEVEIIGAVMAV